MFYLEDVLVISQGEVLQGTLSCKPNARNRRDLDIELSYTFNGKHGSAKRTQQYRMR